MQTREPKKRVNWIFVGALIILFPLIFFTIFMMNTLPPSTGSATSSLDSVRIDSVRHSIYQSDTTEGEKSKQLEGNDTMLVR